jgi:hypothetical protein
LLFGDHHEHVQEIPVDLLRQPLDRAGLIGRLFCHFVSGNLSSLNIKIIAFDIENINLHHGARP